MASVNPCTAPTVADGGALPLDALSEVLLRLSAKELCRLRVVCRWWRSITSDPAFIAAHKTRHAGPLLVGGLLDFPAYPRYADIFVMDLSGNVVKRIRNTGNHLVLPTCLDLVCVTEMPSLQAAQVNVIVLNPATGAMHALPQNLAIAHSHRRTWSDYEASFAFGKVPMGEYKVLSILTSNEFPTKQITEVVTLNTSSPMRWMAKRALPVCVRTGMFDRVVVKGVAYFLLHDLVNGSTNSAGIAQDCIALFDLKTEDWIPSYLQGPISSHPELHDMNNVLIPNEHFLTVQLHLSLAELNDFLVVAHDQRDFFSLGSCLDLWYLMDLEKRIWERKYRIPLGKSTWDSYNYVTPHPSMLLQDGKILICFSSGSYTNQVLQIYNPKTNTWGPDLMNSRNIGLVGIYLGSLLSVRNGDEL